MDLMTTIFVIVAIVMALAAFTAWELAGRWAYLTSRSYRRLQAADRVEYVEALADLPKGTLKYRLLEAQVRLSPLQFYLLSAALGILGACLFWIFFVPGLPALAIGGALAYFPFAYIQERARSRGRKIDEKLAIALTRMAPGLQVNRGLDEVLEEVARSLNAEGPNPLSPELYKTVKDIRTRTVEQAMRDLARRSPSLSLANAAMLLESYYRAGGGQYAQVFNETAIAIQRILAVRLHAQAKAAQPLQSARSDSGHAGRRAAGHAERPADPGCLCRADRADHGGCRHSGDGSRLPDHAQPGLESDLRRAMEGMILLIAVVVAGTAAYFLRQFLAIADPGVARRLAKVDQPVVKRSALDQVGSPLSRIIPDYFKKIEVDLYWASFSEPSWSGRSAGWIAGRQVLMALALGILTGWLLHSSLGLWIGGFTGWTLMRMDLSSKAESARRQVTQELPEFLQLMAAEAASGAGLETVLGRAAQGEDICLPGCGVCSRAHTGGVCCPRVRPAKEFSSRKRSRAGTQT